MSATTKQRGARKPKLRPDDGGPSPVGLRLLPLKVVANKLYRSHGFVGDLYGFHYLEATREITGHWRDGYKDVLGTLPDGLECLELCDAPADLGGGWVGDAEAIAALQAQYAKYLDALELLRRTLCR